MSFALACSRCRRNEKPMNIQKMMREVQRMQEELQRKLAELRVEGSAGGGMVTAVMDGQKNLVSLNISREVVDPEDIEMLQDLIVAAGAGALRRVDVGSQTGMWGMMGMMGGRHI